MTEQELTEGRESTGKDGLRRKFISDNNLLRRTAGFKE